MWTRILKKFTIDTMKHITILILVFAIFLSFAQQVKADNPDLEIDFFYSKTCVHCIAEQKFLDEIEIKYPQIKINRHLNNDPKNHELLRELLKKHDAEKYFGAVPLTFIGDDFIPGFDSPEKIGKQIEESIQKQLEGKNEPDQNLDGSKLIVKFKIDISKYSLPVLAIILGTLDGFNICSLGALILILGLVLALRSRKKILLFGGLFILTTAVIYGILIILWHQLFSILAPYQKLMTILIGILGIGGGIYFLKEFIKFKKQGPACKTVDSGIVTKFSSKIQKTLKNPKSILAVIISILLFAAVITIVEFPCSAAVPVIFAGVLAKAQLPAVLYFLYIALFVLLYMLDEILIFLIALFTMKLWLTSPKFVTWITLVEAIILFLLGFYYLIGF